MFTGIIEELGSVAQIDLTSSGARLVIYANLVSQGTRVGDSICVNGTCLTVVECGTNSLSFEAVPETLQRTTLSRLKPGDLVNLERALQPLSRLGGHFVQGHIDGVGTILSQKAEGNGYRFTISPPKELLPYIAEKGSIAVEGVSLTVARLDNATFDVVIIPHTWKMTTFHRLHPGDKVNIETDILAKYVARLLQFGALSPEGGGPEWLIAKVQKENPSLLDLLKEEGFV